MTRKIEKRVENGEDRNELLEHATRVFRSEERAKTWLTEPSYGLGGKKPAEVDVREAKRCLVQIEYGVYV